MAIGKTPYRNHFMKPCNPVSIKPNDYKQSNIINKYCQYANKKGDRFGSNPLFRITETQQVAECRKL